MPKSSRRAKAGVTPIPKPARTTTTPGLKRTAMTRRPSKLKRTPLGHTSREQKRKIKREGARVAHLLTVPISVDPAHITPRALGGCDHEDCVIGLPRTLHRQYDDGKLDILPFLSLEEQAHAVAHLGILGALRRTTGEDYVPRPDDHADGTGNV
jgi:hypothetical protein